jgi:4-hydroxy-3-methylbut-2-enyl diphosphate reductase IspH
MTAKPHDAVAVTENLSPSISTFTDSPFLQQPSATLCAAPLLSNPHSRACLLLRGLVQHVLSPAATLALSPRLDCLQALRDKTLYVTQQEEAEIGVLNAGCHLVVLSSRTHHGIPRLQGIAREKGKEVFIVEHEEDVDAIRLTRFESIGVIVQTTFWMESYKKIMARILERFANVQIRNTACIDSLQRLPEVEKLAKEVDAIIIFGWTEGMTTRMVEVARAFNAETYKIEKVDDLKPEWIRGKEKVGIIGANETPDWMINEAIERIKSMAA